MLALVEKYTADIPPFYPSSGTAPAVSESPGAVVVLTGTTGALGSSLLADLLSSSAVSKVFALNRDSPTGHTLMARQTQSFIDRGLDTSLLDSDKLILLTCDLSARDLGLDRVVLYEVRYSSCLCYCSLTLSLPDSSHGDVHFSQWCVNASYSALTADRTHVLQLIELTSILLSCPLKVPS
jgi:hypothetical protein